jgi:hypothetical protein
MPASPVIAGAVTRPPQPADPLPSGIGLQAASGKKTHRAAPRAPAAGTKNAAPPKTAAAPKTAAPGAPALQRSRKAPAPSPWRPPAGATQPAAGYAPAAAASGEWAFLTDKGLSIEEKLARFAGVAMAKIDRELEAKMAQYKADYADAKAAASEKKGGFSLFGALESAVPGLADLSKVFGESAFKKAASALGGPVLAAAATALGMPELAPAALKYGGEIASLAFAQIGGSSSSAAPSTTKKEAGAPDEKMAMLELQMLVEKQQRMFTAISSTLKVLHDTQMAAVHNLR